MFRDEKLELKVGLFIGLGIFLMFFIVFSIGDLYLFREGYDIRARFDFVNGIKRSSPVRFAGVDVGEVKDIVIYYDEASGKSRIRVDLRISSDVRIDRDAIARINTLGLLGEQYLEISPGTSGEFLRDGDFIQGKDPVNIGVQMEKMMEFADNASAILAKLREGEGTLGKLITDDALYNDLAGIFAKISRGEGTLGKLLGEETLYRDLETIFGRLRDGEGTLGKMLSEETLYRDLEIIFGRLRDGEGTVGKFLADETVYRNLEYFTSDIKANPWKLLMRRPERNVEADESGRGARVSPR
jgi:phospholipid/cholesterol/gamma-HCH transport system substrate-binding protein